jgi:hypothetical protein
MTVKDELDRNCRGWMVGWLFILLWKIWGRPKAASVRKFCLRAIIKNPRASQPPYRWAKKDCNITSFCLISPFFRCFGFFISRYFQNSVLRHSFKILTLTSGRFVECYLITHLESDTTLVSVRDSVCAMIFWLKIPAGFLSSSTHMSG